MDRHEYLNERQLLVQYGARASVLFDAGVFVAALVGLIAAQGLVAQALLAAALVLGVASELVSLTAFERARDHVDAVYAERPTSEQRARSWATAVMVLNALALLCLALGYVCFVARV